VLNLKEKLSGKFIVFDGPDGSGKGTQIRLLAERLRSEGLAVTLARDPGGTEIGDRIRNVLLGYDLSRMDVRCETFLFMASRAQLVSEVVEPAIGRGDVVLCDRFISATCAYQGAAGYDVARVLELGRCAVGQTWPQLTLIIDVPVEEGFRRTGRKPQAAESRRKDQGDQGLLFHDVRTDAMEARPVDYHRRVRSLFLALPPGYPGRIEVIDAMSPPEQVHAKIVEVLERVDL
jgi:dTMP kinase